MSGGVQMEARLCMTPQRQRAHEAPKIQTTALVIASIAGWITLARNQTSSLMPLGSAGTYQF
jgi:hypothetical protein